MYSKSTYNPNPWISCWNCRHWHGETEADDSYIVCRGPYGPVVVGQPDQGCAFWSLDPRKDPLLFTWLAGDWL